MEGSSQAHEVTGPARRSAAAEIELCEMDASATSSRIKTENRPPPPASPCSESGARGGIGDQERLLLRHVLALQCEAAEALASHCHCRDRVRGRGPERAF
jgi:hypothetical protein